MKLALNGATTMKADLETDIRAASAAGFDYLEIWAAKLRIFLASRSTADLKEVFAAHAIKPYSINSIERINFRRAEEQAALRSECEELCRIASEIDCPYIVVVPGPKPAGADRAEVIGETRRALDELGRIAGRFDLSLAFEFLGQPGSSVRTLDLAREIIACLEAKNVGLVLDSFHFYAGGSTIESLDALEGDSLFIFHINDAEDLPRDRLEDRHRLLPGLGILPLKEIVAALGRIGYDRAASVEIFRPEYWERDPVALAREARESAARVLGQGHNR